LISILVLSNQQDIFTDIKKALANNYIVQFANSSAQFSEVLVDGEINIVIIDAVFLKTAGQEEIAETLSFFPELTIIAAVESGETESLVNLFQSFEIYRYLQQPFTAEQIKKCVDAAARKYSKNKINLPLSNQNQDLSKNKKNKYVIVFSIIILAGVSFLLFLPAEKNSSIEASTASVETNKRLVEESIINDNQSDLLTPDHESINLSAKTGLPDSNTDKNEIDSILNQARQAENNKHYFEPENNNALHYYMAAMNIDSNNSEIINRLTNLNQLIHNELSSYLSNNQYKKSITTVSFIKHQYPEYKYTDILESLITQKGNELLLNANNLSKEENYESALTQLNNAEILLPDKKQELTSAKNKIEELIQNRKTTDELISIINNRMSAGRLVYPEKDSVKYYLGQLKQKNNKASKELESKFTSKLLSQADIAIKNNKFTQAKLYIKEAKVFNLQQNSILSIEEQLESALSQQEENRVKKEQQKRIQELSALASNAIEKNNLVYPENKNAKYYLESAIKIDPENKKVQSQVDTLVKLLLIQIETDIAENTLASASSKLKKTKELGIKQEEISLLEEKLNNAINKR
jgi:hypothetical protein